ncbi:hypothetical protein Taro_042198, partial [Colocasia esculenta]|nr:hypothetical protein [Colocasia esculenta]
LSVSRFLGLCRLASWAVFSGFRSAGSLGVPWVGTRLLFRYPVLWCLPWWHRVSRGDTWLFLPDLVEVRDVGACVVRLRSLVVAPVFRELLCLGGSVGGGATFGGPWRGSGRSARYSGIRAQGSNEICNGLITMAVPKKGTRALLAR